ncbi:MAG: preprotein translocase subunit SecG [Alphaproteobacteria bacterium]|nr:preprotein translocase subunit SecG [Alphaproteobacteria bacterium]
MQQIILVFHILIAAILVGLVLLQRSEGGALGIGGGGGLMSSRGKATTLTRTTAVLGLVFFATSMGLAFLARGDAGARSVMDRAPVEGNAVSAQPAAPATPDSPPEAPLVQPEPGPSAPAPAVPTGE